MWPIGAWSVWRVLLMVFGWMIFVPAAAIAWFVVSTGMVQQGAGSAGVGAVSFGISVPMLIVCLLVWVLPPLLLFAGWIAARSAI